MPQVELIQAAPTADDERSPRGVHPRWLASDQDLATVGISPCTSARPYHITYESVRKNEKLTRFEKGNSIQRRPSSQSGPKISRKKLLVSRGSRLNSDPGKSVCKGGKPLWTHSIESPLTLPSSDGVSSLRHQDRHAQVVFPQVSHEPEKPQVSGDGRRTCTVIVSRLPCGALLHESMKDFRRREGFKAKRKAQA